MERPAPADTARVSAQHDQDLPARPGRPGEPPYCGGVHVGRERPPIAIQVVVWIGLVILLVTVAVFVWLFVLGHGFAFAF